MTGVMIVGLLLGVFIAMYTLGDLPGQDGPPKRRRRRHYDDYED